MGLDRPGREGVLMGRQGLAEGSKPDVKLPGPPWPARYCEICGVLLGGVTKVHFATNSDRRPCPGSWK